jgi:hypothetical protein
MKRRKSAGHRTLPCVTPAITLSHSECLLLHFTLCFLPLRYWAFHDVSHDGSIYLCQENFIVHKVGCFCKNKKYGMCYFLFVSCFSQSSITWTNASIVFRPGRNPYCLFVFHNCFVWLSISRTIIRLNTLQIADVNAIGIYLFDVVGFLTFRIGMTFAIFHCAGIKLYCILMFNKCARISLHYEFESCIFENFVVNVIRY